MLFMKAKFESRYLWIFITLILSAILILAYSYFQRDSLKQACLSSLTELDMKQTKTGEFEQTIDLGIKKYGGTLHIPNVTTSYHSIELHLCGTYVMRQFNFDYKKMEALEGFERAIWKYGYFSKRGEKIIDLASKASFNTDPEVHFGYDFRISPDETYITLREGHPGAGKYNLVIKSLENFKTNNLDEIVVISYTDLTNSDPDIYGSIGFNEWSKDSRYFWGNIFLGAEVTAFFRVDMNDLSHQTFKAPYGTLGGDALVLNPNTGYIPYDPNAYWSPDEEDMSIRKAINLERGIRNELHLYHLPSGKDILVDSTSEPLWRFTPKWISNSELEYKLPGNVTKRYKITN